MAFIQEEAAPRLDAPASLVKTLGAFRSRRKT